MAKFLNSFSQHVLTCEEATQLAEQDSKVSIEGESRIGLASVIRVRCKGCGETLDLESSQKVVGPKGIKRWECNLAAVWGQMATGGGHSKLNETMSVLGVPTMTQRSFVKTEIEIGDWWKQELERSMKAAGEEERRLAIEDKCFYEGVPSITVILDGGWSKHSHKHSYNAKSGVGVIIGLRTQKL